MNSLDKMAYHEAGHAVVAYLSGYFCKKLEITDKHPLENRQDYEFGQDALLISAIYQYKDNPDIYGNLQLERKNNFRKVSLRTIIVLLGGPAAEMIYKNGGKVDLNQSFSMIGNDFEVADKIDYFLSMAKQGQHAANYLKVIFKQVLTLMEAPEVWKAISTLAQTLLHTDEKILERKDIEKILIETGFLHYLGKFRQGNAPQTARPTQTAQPVRPTQTAQPVQPTQTAKPAQPAAAPKGFTREELLKMKESMKNSGNNPKVDKKEGVRKIAEFVKHMKLTEIFIGLTEDPKNIEKISSNIVIEAHSNAVAKEILMYFICLGMEMSPGSSKSKEATCVFVTIK